MTNSEIKKALIEIHTILVEIAGYAGIYSELLHKKLDAIGETLRGSSSQTENQNREYELEQLLRSACAIAERKGEDTHWENFLRSAQRLGINGVTARHYRTPRHKD